MGVTDKQRLLIQAVAQGDLIAAKKRAVDCLNEDTTAKNASFCNRYKNILQSAGSNMIELPHDLKNILYVQDMTNSFHENRYYLTERENKVYEDIIRMKKVNERLMELGIPYVNSTLLYGESGTGKTTFGKYVAYKLGLPFCYLNFTNLIDSYMGGTSKNISKAFSYALANPCVLMLDEIDCISMKRTGSNSGTTGEQSRITIALMQEFDKLPNDVVVIGATNIKDSIDSALLRRFSTKHEVLLFSDLEKEEMIKKYLDDIKVNLPDNTIKEILSKSNNQSMIVNKLITAISMKIAEEL